MLPRFHPVRELDHLSVLVVAIDPAGLPATHCHDDRLVAFGSSLHDPPRNAAWDLSVQSVHSISSLDRQIIMGFSYIDVKYDSAGDPEGYRLRVGEIRVFYDVLRPQVQVLAIVSREEATEWLAEAGKRE
jgi:hypothetical protein